MTREDIIRMAREAGMKFSPAQFSGVLEAEIDEFSLETFAALVAAASEAKEREACAKVAERSWQEFRNTKDAHERLSPAPFKLENFGFNQSTIQQSQIIADNIRARGKA